MIPFLLDAVKSEPSQLAETFDFILKLLGAGTPLGLWLKLKIDRNKDKADRESDKEHQKERLQILVEKIDETNTAQTEQIAGIQKDISELKEVTKSSADISRLRSAIQKAYDISLASFKFKNDNVILAVQSAKELSSQVFANIITDNFETTSSELENSLLNAAKTVKRTCNIDKLKLSIVNLNDFEKTLKNEVKQFCMRYAEIRETYENGVRRQNFIDECANFTKRIVFIVYEKF